jgi:hypothetical protein
MNNCKSRRASRRVSRRVSRRASRRASRCVNRRASRRRLNGGVLNSKFIGIKDRVSPGILALISNAIPIVSKDSMSTLLVELQDTFQHLIRLVDRIGAENKTNSTMRNEFVKYDPTGTVYSNELQTFRWLDAQTKQIYTNLVRNMRKLTSKLIEYLDKEN